MAGSTNKTSETFTQAELREIKIGQMPEPVAEQVIAAIFNNPELPGFQLDDPRLFDSNYQVNKQLLTLLEKIVSTRRGVLDKPSYRLLVAGLQYLQVILSEENVARAVSVSPQSAQAKADPFYSRGANQPVALKGA